MKLEHVLLAVVIIVGVAGTAQIVTGIASAHGGHSSSQLKKEVGRTERSARNLDESFRNLVPPQPTERRSVAPPTKPPQPGAGQQRPGPNIQQENPGPPAQEGPPQYDGHTAAERPPVPLEGTADGAAPAPPEEAVGPVPEPTPEPWANQHTSDLQASVAVEHSLQMKEELAVQDTEYSRAMHNFYNEWSGRYNAALLEHQRFQWRLNQADRMADKYFATQRQLTELMPDAQRRSHYRDKDQEEMEIYRQWQANAWKIMTQADTIMDELRQLNLEITKQTLSADFAALHRDFEQIPAAITTLHTELELFRTRSEELEKRFSPKED